MQADDFRSHLRHWLHRRMGAAMLRKTRFDRVISLPRFVSLLHLLVCMMTKLQGLVYDILRSMLGVCMMARTDFSLHNWTQHSLATVTKPLLRTLIIPLNSAHKLHVCGSPKRSYLPRPWSVKLIHVKYKQLRSSV